MINTVLFEFNHGDATTSNFFNVEGQKFTISMQQSGTVNWTIQGILIDPYANVNNVNVDYTALVTNIASNTTNQTTGLTYPVGVDSPLKAIRLVVNSSSPGGALAMTLCIQSDIRR